MTESWQAEILSAVLIRTCTLRNDWHKTGKIWKILSLLQNTTHFRHKANHVGKQFGAEESVSVRFLSRESLRARWTLHYRHWLFQLISFLFPGQCVCSAYNILGITEASKWRAVQGCRVLGEDNGVWDSAIWTRGGGGDPSPAGSSGWDCMMSEKDLSSLTSIIK